MWMENPRWPPSHDQNELKMFLDTANMIEPKIVNEWSVDAPLQCWYFNLGWKSKMAAIKGLEFEQKTVKSNESFFFNTASIIEPKL